MNLQLIKKLCLIKTEDLPYIIKKFLKTCGYTKVVKTSHYIIAEGDLPICLIAHMDTVFPTPPAKENFFYDNQKKILWNPNGSGFDDRAGIYIILQLLQEGYRPSLIFTDGEEKGGIGANELTISFPNCPFADCRALIQLDRANKNDCVFYDCDNRDFEKYICSFGFKYSIGTFSDISIIAPSWGIAAVNLSVGYEDEHSYCERLYCNWCDNTLEKVRNILEKSESMLSYAYIEKKNIKISFAEGVDWDNHRCIICEKPINSASDIGIQEPWGQLCKECFKQYY